ncbi:hypothetical protein [Pseudomonas sp. S4_EA_1b]|uniref:hypothetical protein n=1 Tax=Pseudomonas sp. S4_EA_1b TaxID=2796960 RepID=UPI0018E60D8A|nr:hypothetical protein [Pseudomonas sp. S4_EA_1b]MBI6601899.1 hypothetical protein [Pseudomonas sp. S4_EA_1b]
MSEVHRYQVVTMLSDAGNKIAYDPHGPWIVMAADHDRVTADQKEGIAKHWQVVCDQRAKIDALQQRLTAADERVDVLEGFLRKAPRGVPGFAEWEKKSIAALKQAEAPPKKVKPTCHWACTGCDICGSAGRGDTWS